MLNNMVHTFMTSSIYIKGIFGCFILGTVSFLLLETALSGMIRSTAHMGRSKKRWIQTLKKRYADYHQLDIRVNNVSSFVDKFIRKKRICGLPVSFWTTLHHLSIAGCGLAGAGGALLLSQQGEELIDVMSCYLTGVTAAAGLLFLSTFLRAREKWQMIRTNLNDYLENVLKNSLNGEKTIEDPEAVEKDSCRVLSYTKENHGQDKPEPVSSGPMTAAQEKLIEEVLQEYFA